MALNTGVGGVDIIESRGVDDVRRRRLLHVLTSWAMTLLTPDVPLRHLLGVHIVVDGVAAIAGRPGWTSHVVRGIVWSPPVGSGFDVISTPDLMGNVPLGRQRKIVVTDFLEIPLLPLRSMTKAMSSLLNVSNGSGFDRSGMIASGCSLGSTTTFAINVFCQRS